MSETLHETTIAMTWEQFAALPEDIRMEYVDGVAIVHAMPDKYHQKAAHRLISRLEAACTQPAEVVGSYGWKPGADEFGPDVMVTPPTGEHVRFTGIPRLVLEILSSNRSHDLVRKFAKYAAAGAPRYWILDPVEPPTLIAWELRDGSYVEVARVTGEECAVLDFGAGTIETGPSELFR